MTLLWISRSLYTCLKKNDLSKPAGHAMNPWQEYAVPILTDNTIHVLMLLLLLFDRWKHHVHSRNALSMKTWQSGETYLTSHFGSLWESWQWSWSWHGLLQGQGGGQEVSRSFLRYQILKWQWVIKLLLGILRVGVGGLEGVMSISYLLSRRAQTAFNIILI